MTATAPPAPPEMAPPPATRESARRGALLRVAALVLLLVLLLLLPMVLPAAQQAVAIRVLLFAILGVAWNIMSGFGGMFSFGHAAYFGLGAYSGAYLLVNHHASPWIGMAVGALLAAAFGSLTAFLSFRYRLRGAYFALATFAFAEMLRLISVNLGLVNRAVGFNVPLLQRSSWWQLQFAAGSPNYYYVALGLTVLAVGVSVAFTRSRLGHYVVAIRDDELAASSLGVPIMRYKVASVAVSAALTAVAGVFYVQYYLFVNPDLAFGNSVSIQAIVPAVIGGVGTIVGPLVGALVVGPLSDVTATLLRNPPAALSFLSGRSGLDVMLYAALLIVIVMFLPRGIYGEFRARVSRR